MTPEDIQHNHEFSASTNHSKYSPEKIKVIGIGGGGGNAVNHMYNTGARNVTFIVANTDMQALNLSPVPNKVLLGPKALHGLGAGNEPDRAREAAEESAQEIREILDKNTTDMVFITAGMGGGTGTGASPVIARLAHEQGILTIGIVTIPFLFEGQKKILKAIEGARTLGEHVDALLVINNERLSEIYSDMSFINAFGKADDVLTMAAMSISEIITCDGHINLDFNDVDKTLRDGGTAIISTGYGEGPDRVTKAINDALNSPLLRNTDILTSKKLLFNIYFSRQASSEFKIEETNQIRAFVSNITDVDVIWGVAFDDSLGDKVKFTILAAGFDVTVADRPKKTAEAGAIVLPGRENPDRKETSDEEEARNEKELKEIYGQKFEEFERTKNEQRYMILQPDELDNDQAIETLATSPTFSRRKQIRLPQTAAEAPAPTATAEAPAPAAPAKPASKNHVSFDDMK